MIYAENLEENVIKQWEKAIDQPWVRQHALMADAHLGYTMPIGGVARTDGMVVPSWVGYDIGCGVSTVRLDIDPMAICKCSDAIVNEVLKVVPVGFNKHPRRFNCDNKMRSYFSREGRKIWDAKGGSRHLGTLGGGNHFIEIGADEKDRVYITIHSGSRGIGHGIATHYIKAAHPEHKCKEGSYPLFADSVIGEEYLNDQAHALIFAKDNRDKMTEMILGAIAKATDYTLVSPITSTYVNKTHNHVLYEHGGWVHRKGATIARRGVAGVIPGNMRDGSYIVRGLGNPESLNSASHGAGRSYGRKAAHRELSLEKFQADMVGIKCQATKNRLDEAPDAYKNFGRVMELQSELIEIVAHVRPLINIKG